MVKYDGTVDDNVDTEDVNLIRVATYRLIIRAVHRLPDGSAPATDEHEARFDEGIEEAFESVDDAVSQFVEGLGNALSEIDGRFSVEAID